MLAATISLAGMAPLVQRMAGLHVGRQHIGGDDLPRFVAGNGADFVVGGTGLSQFSQPRAAQIHERQSGRNAARVGINVESEKSGAGEATAEPVPTPGKAAADREPKRRKVIFAPGAFAAVIRNHEEESRFATAVLNSLDPIERRAVVEEDNE